MRKNRNARPIVWEVENLPTSDEGLFFDPQASASAGTFDVWGVAR